jgi:hypothetical protein
MGRAGGWELRDQDGGYDRNVVVNVKKKKNFACELCLSVFFFFWLLFLLLFFKMPGLWSIFDRADRENFLCMLVHNIYISEFDETKAGSGKVTDLVGVKNKIN